MKKILSRISKIIKIIIDFIKRYVIDRFDDVANDVLKI